MKHGMSKAMARLLSIQLYEYSPPKGLSVDIGVAAASVQKRTLSRKYRILSIFLATFRSATPL